MLSSANRSNSHLSLFNPSAGPACILHITDSEGSGAFFSALKNSTIVKYDSQDGLSFHKSNGVPYFIFGGDVTDRGNQDLAITKLLVDFKKRYPNNVFLLVGNREITKTRFKIELAADRIRERLLFSDKPYWVSPATHPRDYVEMAMKKANWAQSAEAFVDSLSIEQCQIIYLKWMLEKTMGCPHSFRYRGEELARNRSNQTITDEEILQSFLEQTSPEGITGQYLQLAQVGVIIPGTGVLAVHGGLQPTSIGRIPTMQPNEKPIANLASWIRQFNEWYQKQVQYWMEFKSTTLTRPGCTPLDDCVLHPNGEPKTAITDWMMNSERQFVAVPEVVSRYLADNLIQVVLTGHQPCGDHPAILRTMHNAVFINGDTGYAAFNKANLDDTRGCTSHTLEIEAHHDNANINIKAVLPDKSCITSQLKLKGETIENDPFIGLVSPNHQLVQCRLPNGDYRLINQKNYQVNYSTVTEPELRAIFSVGAPTMGKI